MVHTIPVPQERDPFFQMVYFFVFLFQNHTKMDYLFAVCYDHEVAMID